VNGAVHDGSTTGAVFRAAVVASTNSDTRWGGTVGVGFEYGFAPNWSAGIEYDHLFLDNRTATFATPGGVIFAADRIRGDADLVMGRINYRFGWGGPPVAARY